MGRRKYHYCDTSPGLLARTRIIALVAQHDTESPCIAGLKLSRGGYAWECLTFYVFTRLLAHTALDNFQIVLSVRLFLVKNSMGAVPTTITVTRGLHIFLDTDRVRVKLLGCHFTGQHLYCMHSCHPWPSYEVLNFLTSSAAGFVTACCVVVAVHAGLV